MIGKHLRQFRNRQATEAAIGTEPKFRQILPGGLEPRPEASHIVDHAEIDARALWVESFQRREETIVAAIEYGNVNPINFAARRLHEAIGERDSLSEIFGLKTRPASERAKTEVIAERDLRRDMRREVAHFAQIALDRTFQGVARDT